MRQRLGLTIVAILAAALVQFAGAAMAQPGGRPDVKQIQLTEKQVQGVVAAQKDISAVLEKIQGPPPDELPPPILAELDAAAKKHGFKDFNDYDEVLGNITMVMTGIDPKTKTPSRQLPSSRRSRMSPRTRRFPRGKRNKCWRSSTRR